MKTIIRIEHTDIALPAKANVNTILNAFDGAKVLRWDTSRQGERWTVQHPVKIELKIVEPHQITERKQITEGGTR